MKYHDLGKHHLVMLGLNDSFDRTLTMSASMLTSSNIPRNTAEIPRAATFSVSPSISKIWIIPSL
ncbi:uncharacterized protein PHALS_11976 [Plasmopara halstedii]|uniref:Uncharacterized protein n=1 Tax=Plasmopara halstedii TaxID=4781 RepID=A0A0P1AL08_PLAHL|nr:uncharacterized protein PHALS_11976 [Plasmopara halstedii]CEG41644.1 hypothetical protein PHALS_11976 [Plasmopara halstedii]|eukprot:XP_024578013.1 hypothetical protein PHALS_11976 [Plasmopara halstedii]